MTSHSVGVDQLRNIGSTIARRLKEVGISTAAELRSIGAVGAYQRICAHHPGATIPVCYYLYSLEGALRGEHWDALAAKVKDRLLTEASVHDRAQRTKRKTRAATRRR
jgi:DNA transformation protein